MLGSELGLKSFGPSASNDNSRAQMFSNNKTKLPPQEKGSYSRLLPVLLHKESRGHTSELGWALALSYQTAWDKVGAVWNGLILPCFCPNPTESLIG